MDAETMRYYYQNGLWDKERLDKLLAAGKITKAELEQVVNGAAEIKKSEGAV